MVAYIFLAKFSADKVGKEMLPNGVEVRSKVFVEAAKCLEEMIDSGAANICTKILEDEFNYAIDWEDVQMPLEE